MLTLAPKQPKKQPAKTAQKTAKTAQKTAKISFESVLHDALVGVSSAVAALTDIVEDDQTEAKDKVAAAKTLAQILVQIADAQVTEKLPLLEEIAKNARNKSA